ncbi:uncharacterized protein LOC114579558 [Dendrobium catenatum]|uniref:uncharacterized protein LOC114579558 n=1 Tax=Dendrobium catenatum TaxID=906689 RepID=UPI00109FB872|nr:uncharacterized protein LOC114579558 [Dendrobium catenatum]
MDFFAPSAVYGHSFVSCFTGFKLPEFWPEYQRNFQGLENVTLSQIPSNLMPSSFHFSFRHQYRKSKQQQDSHPHQQKPPPFSQSLPPQNAADFITSSQQDFHLQKQPYPFFMTLPQELPFPFSQDHFPHSVDFSLPFQQDFIPQELLFPFAQSLPPHEQPSTLSQSFSPHLVACLNAEDLPTSQLPSDSPVWNQSEDLNWCDSLFLDY